MIDRTLGVKAHLMRRINFRLSGLLVSNTVKEEEVEEEKEKW